MTFTRTFNLLVAGSIQPRFQHVVQESRRPSHVRDVRLPHAACSLLLLNVIRPLSRRVDLRCVVLNQSVISQMRKQPVHACLSSRFHNLLFLLTFPITILRRQRRS